MVITNDDFDAALGDFLAKATDVSIKNVLGIFDKEKTVSENIANLKDGSSGAALQDTITFLKSNSPEYPVAQQVLSCKNRTKELYSRDIAKFLDLVKPTQCLSCRENYIPAAEQCASDEPKCYLCQRPSHGVCYQDIVIKPELGIIFVCTECISVKAARELTADLQKQGEHPSKKPVDDKLVQTVDKNEQNIEERVSEDGKTNQDNEDCPLYLKHQCPHGLTGKREIDGNPCPYKHRKRCKYYTEFGPTGCRFGKKCHFLHPAFCQNSLKLKMCLNRNCQELHIKGTQRNANNIPENRQQSITTSNRFPSWMAENSHANTDLNRESDPKSDRLNPWNNQRTHKDKQPPQNTELHNSRDFLQRHLEEMKADLMSFIRASITQAVPSIQPQYTMMQPTSYHQHVPAHQVPVENWTNSAINVHSAPQQECTQTNILQASNYQHQYPALNLVPQKATC